MGESLNKLFESLGIKEFFDNLMSRLFEYTLTRDKKKKAEYEGYPSSFTKVRDKLSKRTGIPFVNHDKGDYTFAPLIDYIMFNTGLTNTKFHKFLNKINMRLWGEPFSHGRLKAQKKLLDSYLEYESKYDNLSIIDNLLTQKHNYYILKILAEYEAKASEYSLGFKEFILENEDYFSEIAVFFTIDERTVIDSAKDAVQELDSLVKSSQRKQLMNANFIYTSIDMLIFVIVFGEVMIPQVLDNFDADIKDFSAAIRSVYRLSRYLKTRWYIVILVLTPIVILLRTNFVKTVKDYLKIKSSFISEYVISDELSKFLKTYHNIMGHVSPREAFEYAYSRLDNMYLKHILKQNIDGSETDIADTAKPVAQILAEIPYINQEYIDMMVQAYAVGKPQEGLEKVIDIAEPRVENASKKINKNVVIGTFVVSSLLTLILAFMMYRDTMNIVEISDQMFIDSLRK